MIEECLRGSLVGAYNDTSSLDSQLLSFLDIDEEAKASAAELWAVVEPQLTAVISAFYARLATTPMGALLQNDVVDRLKRKQRDHWTLLFTGGFNEEYLNSARRVGLRHREVELDLRWYVAAYMMLKMEFVNVIVKSEEHSVATKGRLVRTLDRYFAFDLGLAISTYLAGVID